MANKQTTQLSEPVRRLNDFIEANSGKGAIRLSMRGLADELGITTEWLRQKRKTGGTTPEMDAKIEKFLSKHKS
jgi:hypothetical protein